MKSMKEYSSLNLMSMLIRQITLLTEDELEQVWMDRFPNAEKREYYEELGRMFPSFKSRMMGMDIHGLLQAGYTVDIVDGQEFHNFVLKKKDEVVVNVVDASLEGAWKRIYLIAVELDSAWA